MGPGESWGLLRLKGLFTNLLSQRMSEFNGKGVFRIDPGPDHDLSK